MGVGQISEGKITAQCWRVLTNTGSGQECWKSWPNLSIPKKALGVARPKLGGGWGVVHREQPWQGPRGLGSMAGWGFWRGGGVGTGEMGRAQVLSWGAYRGQGKA